MPRKKVLVVDASRTSRMLALLIIRRAQWDVVTATDGDEAVVTALQERPDLILMDAQMPRMSGFDACRELRRHEATRTTPVFMVTARGESENIKKGFESGCTDYITKPIDSYELLQKMRSYLGPESGR